jgi:5-methylcytosine-specific restriction endonuclease McrA
MSSHKVLVLNQDYSAISVCSVQKAFLLVYLSKAEMVAETPNECLRSVSRIFPKPSIIRLHHYVHMPYRNGVVLTRQNLFKRDSNCCQYCGATRELTLDHVMPRSRGGKTSWENLITACKSCNSRKGDLTPEEARMPMRSRPFKPNFVLFLRDFNGKISEEWMLYLGKKLSNHH